MKALFLSFALIGLLALGSYEAKAQGPYASPYWNGVEYHSYPYPQQYDPYYDLHVMHYQLYLQYPGYPVYQPCCFFGTVIAPLRSAPITKRPRVVVPPARPSRRR